MTRRTIGLLLLFAVAATAQDDLGARIQRVDASIRRVALPQGFTVVEVNGSHVQALPFEGLTTAYGYVIVVAWHEQQFGAEYVEIDAGPLIGADGDFALVWRALMDAVERLAEGQ